VSRRKSYHADAAQRAASQARLRRAVGVTAVVSVSSLLVSAGGVAARSMETLKRKIREIRGSS
jgi:hypothetical protein